MRPPTRTRFHPWARPAVELEADRLLAENVSAERELKFRLPDAPAFSVVLGAAAPEGAPKPAIQRTHVFDTPDRDLLRNGYRLRVREEDGRWYLAAKGKELKTGPFAKDAAQPHPEVEIQLGPEMARALVQGVGSPLEVLARAPELSPADRTFATGLLESYRESPIQHLGTFMNERFRIPWQPPEAEALHCMLELDRTHFPGGRVHFELEVELPPEANSALFDAALRRWMDELAVLPGPSSGKIKRFFEALDAVGVDSFS